VKFRLFVLLLLFFLFLPVFSEARSRRSYGINTEFQSEQLSDKVHDLGVGWARITISWYQVEFQKGAYDWSEPDTAIARAGARGIKILAILYGTPKWANGGRSPNYPPRNSQDWRDFVFAVTAHYKDNPSVKAYSLWNEPNVDKFWRGSSFEYIDKILKPGYKGTKSVKPTILIVAPELAHVWVQQPEWWLWVIAPFTSSYYDVLSLHYYPDAWFSFESYLDDLIKPYRSGKPVWITEIGMECRATRCSDDSQSHAYLRFLKAQRNRSRWFKKIFPYRIWDPLKKCGIDGNGFGLTTGDNLDDKAVFQTYHDYIFSIPFTDPKPSCH
jgi:hypothetical protein